MIKRRSNGTWATLGDDGSTVMISWTHPYVMHSKGVPVFTGKPKDMYNYLDMLIDAGIDYHVSGGAVYVDQL